MTSQSKEKPARIQADDYGDLIAKLRDMKLVSYRCHGSYQGSYLCVLLDEASGGWGDVKVRRLFFYVGDYGSCSGCDWFEAEQNHDGTFDFKVANDYVSQMTPTFILPARPYAADELLAMLQSDRSYDFEFGRADAEKLATAIASATTSANA